MALHVDSQGKVHEADAGASDDGSWNPLGGGHRLEPETVMRGAEVVADPEKRAAVAEQIRQTITAKFDEIADHAKDPFAIPLGAKILFAGLGLVVVGGPIVAVWLAARATKAGVKAAEAAAPAVASLGPAIVPFFPEAAPVVAAARLFGALKGARAGAPVPSSTGQDFAELVQAMGARAPLALPSPRSQPPSSAMLSSVLRAANAPPSDPWAPGGPLAPDACGSEAMQEIGDLLDLGRGGQNASSAGWLAEHVKCLPEKARPLMDQWLGSAGGSEEWENRTAEEILDMLNGGSPSSIASTNRMPAVSSTKQDLARVVDIVANADADNKDQLYDIRRLPAVAAMLARVKGGSPSPSSPSASATLLSPGVKRR